MKKITWLALIASGAVSVVSAQINEAVKKDLISAQARLTQQREDVSSSKLKLASEFEETRTLLLKQRRLSRIARMEESDRRALLSGLEVKKQTYKQDYDYLNGLVRDYGLKFETFLMPGESQKYEEPLSLLRQKTGSKAEQMKARLAVLDAGLTRLEKMIGGDIVAGQAASASGELSQGSFVIAGPVQWFVADQSGVSGAVLREKGSEFARVLAGNNAGLDKLVAGEVAKVSIDVSGGKALALADLESDRLNLFKKGGFWIWPILSIAMFSAIAGIIKFSQIAKVKTPAANWVTEILASLRTGKVQDAEAMVDAASHPAADVMKQCLQYIKAGPDVMEEVLYEQLIGVQSKLQSWLPMVAITAATAPLLGLLGTVSGMIRTFNVITVSGTGDAKPLAGGISEALITTLFGLVVAIPALIIHALLSRRCQGIAQTTEKLGLTLVNGLRAKSVEDKLKS